MEASPLAIYTHGYPYTTLKEQLTAYLPASIPLLRRLQFYWHSPHARVLATFPSNSLPHDHAPWTALYVDRSRAPETQCWVFNSLSTEAAEGTLDAGSTGDEPESNGAAHGQQTGLTPEAQLEAHSQLLAIFRAVYKLDTGLTQDKDLNQHPDFSSNTLVVGAIHEQTLNLLVTLNQKPDDESTGNKHGIFKWCSEPWRTFLYQIDTGEGSTSSVSNLDADLARDLEWSPPSTAADYGLIRSRTHIPRTDATLALLPSIGLRSRQDGRLLAWAFLGVDGAVASLHVEPELRRRGIGKVVFARLLRLLAEPCIEVDGKVVDAYEEIAGERESDMLWGYSHASLENAAGLAVAKAAGGMQRWTAYWTGIDLAAC